MLNATARWHAWTTSKHVCRDIQVGTKCWYIQSDTLLRFVVDREDMHIKADRVSLDSRPPATWNHPSFHLYCDLDLASIMVAADLLGLSGQLSNRHLKGEEERGRDGARERGSELWLPLHRGKKSTSSPQGPSHWLKPTQRGAGVCACCRSMQPGSSLRMCGQQNCSSKPRHFAHTSHPLHHRHAFHGMGMGLWQRLMECWAKKWHIVQMMCVWYVYTCTIQVLTYNDCTIHQGMYLTTKLPP